MRDGWGAALPAVEDCIVFSCKICMQYNVHCATLYSTVYCIGNFSPAMGARNQVGIGLSYRPASLCSLATQLQTRFLELIPRPIAGLKFSTLGQYEG